MVQIFIAFFFVLQALMVVYICVFKTDMNFGACFLVAMQQSALCILSTWLAFQYLGIHSG